MLRRTMSALLLAGFTASTLSACGSSTDTMTDLTQVQQPAQTVQAESISGIKKEIEKTLTAEFKDLDKNKDKYITPDEYGVTTAEQAQSFYALDSNKDGKVSSGEYLPGFFGKIGMELRIKKAADAMFGQLDKNKDNYLSQAELNNPLISDAYLAAFKKYDKEKQWWFFNKGTKGKLSKSEFENMFAHVALSANTAAPTPAPAPVDPAPAPADPSAPTDPAAQ